MKVVDFFLECELADARDAIVRDLVAHGFTLTWQTPWDGLAKRGWSWWLFSLQPIQFGVTVMHHDNGTTVLRLDRRQIPSGQNEAQKAIAAADEFEHLCDETAAYFGGRGELVDVEVYDGALFRDISLLPPAPPPFSGPPPGSA